MVNGDGRRNGPHKLVRSATVPSPSLRSERRRLKRVQSKTVRALSSGKIPILEKFLVSKLGIPYKATMNVVTHRRLREFWTVHPQARGPLSGWFEIVRHAEWRNTQDVKADFRSADFVADNRVIFDIGGNKYRIVARVSYEYKQVLVKFVGTHAEYDKINPATV